MEKSKFELELENAIAYLEHRSIRTETIKKKHAENFQHVVTLCDVQGVLELVQGGGLTEFLLSQKKIMGNQDTFIIPNP